MLQSKAEIKGLLDELCVSLIFICRDETNNLSIPFRTGFKYLRFVYSEKDVFQPLKAWHSFVEKVMEKNKMI